MPPPRRRTRRRRSGGKGGSRRSAGGAAARRAAARRAKQRNDARRAEIRDQARNPNNNRGANVATGGSSTGRESGIAAANKTNNEQCFYKKSTKPFTFNKQVNFWYIW